MYPMSAPNTPMPIAPKMVPDGAPIQLPMIQANTPSAPPRAAPSMAPIAAKMSPNIIAEIMFIVENLTKNPLEINPLEKCFDPQNFSTASEKQDKSLKR